MKKTLLGILALTLVGLSAPSAQAAKVSVSFFYDALDPYGEWIEAPDYGYVWHPRDVDDAWRPYTVGSWAYTDAGWTWVSEEPFGWATYHYGRWVDLERTGWVWVPDNTWGPAWVSWRRSEQHVGWAPLPPEARFETRVGFHGWVDSYYDIGPTYYSFVRVRDLGAPRLRTVIIEPRQNITIINETRNITNITYVNNVVYNEGPEYDVIVRETAQPIRRLRLERRTDVDLTFERGSRDRSERFATEVTGDSLRIVAPEIEEGRDRKPDKIARKIDRLEVNRGWRNAGDEKQVKELRAKVASEAKAPAGLPEKAQLRGTASTEAEKPGSVAEEKPARGREKKSETEAPAVAGQDSPKKSREMKPGEPAEAPAAATTADAPEKSKAGRSETSAARKKGESEDAPKTGAPEPSEKATARKKGEDPAPAATAEKRDQKRESAPEATAKRRGEDRPEARDEKMPDRPKAATEDGDRKRPAPAEDAREPQPKRGERSEKPARPEATERPEGAPRGERPERKPSPEAERPPENRPRPEAAERTKRDNPPTREERSPERSKPKAAERSPENRPPAGEPRSAAEAPAQPAAEEGGKPDKGAKKEKKD